MTAAMLDAPNETTSLADHLNCKTILQQQQPATSVLPDDSGLYGPAGLLLTRGKFLYEKWGQCLS